MPTCASSASASKISIMTGDILNSWKEVAGYVGRGVRTVQRWEAELGFPVRRPRGKNRSAVIALKHEIDLWLRTPRGDEIQQKFQELTLIDGDGLIRNDEAPRARAVRPHSHEVALVERNRLISNAEALQTRAAALITRSTILQQQIARVMQFGSWLRASCLAGRNERKTWTMAHPVSQKENSPRHEAGR